MQKFPNLIAIVLVGALASACGAGSSSEAQRTIGSMTEPTSMPRGERSYEIPFLLYTGNGTWGPEVSSLQSLFQEKGMAYETADASELSSLSVDELARFGAIVWPGGTGTTQVRNLNAATRARIRQAVQERGVSWIGFCAGSFVAVAPPPAPGENPEYGIGVVPGSVLDYYYLEHELNRQGKPDFAIVTHQLPDGSTRDLVWYGGPVVPESPAGVIARYPNGEPSISQMWSGNGFVILSAVHPAAPESVSRSFGTTDADGPDHDYAWMLIEAALKRTELPAF